VRDSGSSPINVSKVTASTAQLHPKPASNSNPEATKDRLEPSETVKDRLEPSETVKDTIRSSASSASSNPPSTKQMKVAKVPITSGTLQDAKAASTSAAASSSSASFKFIQHTSNSSNSSKPPRPSNESSVDYSTIEMKIRSVEQDLHIQSIDTTAQTESSTLSLSTSVSSPMQKGEADTAATSEIQRHTQDHNGSSVPAVSPSSSPARHSIITTKPPLPPSKRHTASRPEKGVLGVGSVPQTNKERSPQKDLGSRGLDPTHSLHIPERSSTPSSHLMIRSSTPAQHLFEQYDDDSNESSKHFEEYLEDRPVTSTAGSSMHPSYKKIAVPHADAPLERAGAASLSTTTRSTAATGEPSQVRTFQKRTKV
jgi:hypothetical protein